MERGFYNDDLEDLIKQKADQYKMYPSDQVWKGIHRSLHTRKRWYWVSFLLFLSGITYYAIVQLLSPSSASSAKKPSTNINPATATPFSAIAARGNQAIIIPFSTNRKQNGEADPVPGEPTSYVVNPERLYPQASALTINSIDPATAALVSNGQETEELNGLTGEKNSQERNLLAKRLHTIAPPATPVTNAASENNTLPIAVERIGLSETDSPQAIALTDKKATADKAIPFDAAAAADEKQVTWLQEYAAYEISVPKTKRLSWQLAFAPTVSYRNLTSGSASFTAAIKNIPVSTSQSGDPEKLVNHKPALGFELGSHFLYAVNKNLQIRAGAQFNYSRYAIQAYGSYSTDVATIALESTPNSRPDSITNYSRIRNFGGDISEDIQNEYFQLSMPVGIQFRLVGNDKIFIGAAATVMPTWLINRKAYLITTDFKNYTREPSLVRTWNVNASAELFLAYKTGDLQWQVGPQFRRQLFSTYVQAYPIREYLMEYGIKIGVTKTIR